MWPNMSSWRGFPNSFMPNPGFLKQLGCLANSWVLPLGPVQWRWFQGEHEPHMPVVNRAKQWEDGVNQLGLWWWYKPLIYRLNWVLGSIPTTGKLLGRNPHWVCFSIPTILKFDIYCLQDQGARIQYMMLWEHFMFSIVDNQNKRWNL